MKLQKVAICLYGQYRTGDVCIPHVKDMIDMIDGVDIDYFCSVKTSISYHTPDGTVDMNSSNELLEADIEKISNFLNKKLHPKRINFLNDKLHVEINDIVRPDFFIFTGIIDSITLKQNYEAETGVEYDAVILLRYDFIMRPTAYISKMIKSIKDANDIKVFSNDPDKFYAFHTNDPYLFGGCHPYTFFPNSIGDLLLVFTGSAADRLCYELISFVDSILGYYTSNTKNKYDVYFHLYDCHTILTYLSSRISIPISDLPSVRKNEDDENIGLLSEKANTDLKSIPLLAIARPNDRIIGKNPTDDTDFDYIMNLWVTNPNK